MDYYLYDEDQYKLDKIGHIDCCVLDNEHHGMKHFVMIKTFVLFYSFVHLEITSDIIKLIYFSNLLSSHTDGQ